jgi:hypothetical protein
VILTHLVLLEFWTGAGGTDTAGSFSGFTTHMPLAFFDGFTESGAGGGGGDGLPRRLLLNVGL